MAQQPPPDHRQGIINALAAVHTYPNEINVYNAYLRAYPIAAQTALQMVEQTIDDLGESVEDETQIIAQHEHKIATLRNGIELYRNLEEHISEFLQPIHSDSDETVMELKDNDN